MIDRRENVAVYIVNDVGQMVALATGFYPDVILFLSGRVSLLCFH